MENSFKERDKENLIDLLNFLGEKARFDLNTKEVIKFFGLLAWAQKELVPKVDQHILEVKRIVQAPQPSPEPEPKKRGRK